MTHNQGFLDKPYFLSNPAWYKFDETEWRYVLTDKAPPKAVESYKEYYEAVEENES